MPRVSVIPLPLPHNKALFDHKTLERELRAIEEKPGVVILAVFMRTPKTAWVVVRESK